MFQEDEISGFQEEVQLREQDFGNFQDQEGKKHEKAERMRYGRFFYRCAPACMAPRIGCTAAPLSPYSICARPTAAAG